MEHQTLPRIERNADVPLLPLDEIAFYCVTWSLWLNNAERLQSSPPFLLHQVAVVVDIQRWDNRRDLVLPVYADNLQTADVPKRCIMCGSYEVLAGIAERD